MNRKDWDAKKETLSFQIQNAVVLATDPSLTYVQRSNAVHHLVSLRVQLAAHKMTFNEIKENHRVA